MMNVSENQAALPRMSGAHRQAIDLFLEEFYPNAREAGRMLAECSMGKTQVQALENLIVSTSRLSEIVNFIKNQAGKERAGNKWQNVAPSLLAQIDAIEQKAAEIAGEDAAARLRVKLVLARGWARQVVAHYLYLFNQ